MTYFESWIIDLGRLESSGLTQPLKPYSFFCKFKKNSCVAYQPILKQILLHHWDKVPLSSANIAERACVNQAFDFNQTCFQFQVVQTGSTVGAS